MTNKTNLIKVNYYKSDLLMTTIWVDYRTNEVEIHNFTDEICYRAFGINENPSIQDFEDFLQDRCCPKERDHCKEIIRDLGLPNYEPYEIVKLTNGRTGEDDCWVEILENVIYENIQ